MQHTAESLGWRRCQDQGKQYFFKLNLLAESEFVPRGIGPTTSTHITYIPQLGEPKEMARTFEVTGKTARHYMAVGTHRFATQEEVERMFTERKARDLACDAMTLTAQHKQELRLTPAYVEATKQLAAERK